MKISASLHAADPLRLAEAVSAIRPYVESLHVDVMDGRFAPAFGFGERLVDSLVADGGLPIDVHLMVERPEDWAVRFAKLGARSVAFHIEAAEEPCHWPKRFEPLALWRISRFCLRPSHLTSPADVTRSMVYFC